MNYPAVKYSADWNGKLTSTNSAFSDLRIWNENKYQVGHYYDVYLKDKVRKNDCAELVAAQPVMLKNITEAMAWLTTGYPLHSFLTIINKMYADYIRENGETALFGWYVFHWVSRDAIADNQKENVSNWMLNKELQEIE